MTGKPKLTGLGIALGAGLGAAFGVAAGHMAVWLAVGVAIGMLLGSMMNRKPAECPMCEEMHAAHSPEQKDAK